MQVYVEKFTGNDFGIINVLASPQNLVVRYLHANSLKKTIKFFKNSLFPRRKKNPTNAKAFIGGN